MVYSVSPLLFGAMLAYIAPTSVLGHGRLWDPPSRSTMWRRNFATPPNYQDNELNCGGLSREIANGYKCGLCGDPYDGVRDNEEGGKYSTGVISRTYQQGQIVTLQVELTANHKGYFEFKLCPKSRSDQRTTQECLDRYPLALADGNGSRYKLTSGESRMYEVNVVLPAGVTCEYCVIQWRYHAGNNWGQDPDGTQCIGCGPQEEFYGCADVQIIQKGSGNGNSGAVNPSYTVANAQSSSLQSSPQRPTTGNRSPSPSSATPSSATQSRNGVTNCQGVPGRPDLNGWCRDNCAMGYCPPSHCQCLSGAPASLGKVCKAAGLYAKTPGMDAWCVQNCARDYCPTTHCSCI